MKDMIKKQIELLENNPTKTNIPRTLEYDKLPEFLKDCSELDDVDSDSIFEIADNDTPIYYKDQIEYLNNNYDIIDNYISEFGNVELSENIPKRC